MKGHIPLAVKGLAVVVSAMFVLTVSKGDWLHQPDYYCTPGLGTACPDKGACNPNRNTYCSVNVTPTICQGPPDPFDDCYSYFFNPAEGGDPVNACGWKLSCFDDSQVEAFVL